jgi:hypothetical protein
MQWGGIFVYIHSAWLEDPPSGGTQTATTLDDFGYHDQNPTQLDSERVIGHLCDYSQSRLK